MLTIFFPFCAAKNNFRFASAQVQLRQLAVGHGLKLQIAFAS